ncbi:hypothetical protein [Chryseobacterium wanjuense]
MDKEEDFTKELYTSKLMDIGSLLSECKLLEYDFLILVGMLKMDVVTVQLLYLTLFRLKKIDKLISKGLLINDIT